MSLNRYRARTDANHKTITKGLRDAGVKYWYAKKPCDVIAAHKVTREPHLLEIKRDKDSKMTPVQQELRIFIAPSHFHRVETVEQALQAVGVIEC